MILSLVVFAAIASVTSASYIPAQYGAAAVSYAPTSEISYGYAATPVIKATPAYQVAKTIPVQVSYTAPASVVRAYGPAAYGPVPAAYGAVAAPLPAAYAAYPAY